MSISNNRLKKIEEFENKIGYSFNDKGLIDVALLILLIQMKLEARVKVTKD